MNTPATRQVKCQPQSNVSRKLVARRRVSSGLNKRACAGPEESIESSFPDSAVENSVVFVPIRKPESESELGGCRRHKAGLARGAEPPPTTVLFQVVPRPTTEDLDNLAAAILPPYRVEARFMAAWRIE